MGDDKIKAKEAEPIQKTGETIADTMIALLDKLAPNDSPLKINFDQLSVGQGPLQAKITGTIALQISLPKT